MHSRQKSDSESLVETISKFQDHIEDTRFTIASIKIQSAFRIIMKIVDKKITIASVYFLSRVKHISMKKIIHSIERPINIIFQNLQKARERAVMKAFVKIKIISENRRISQNNQNLFKTPKKINQKMNSQLSQKPQQMTNQQIQEESLFLKEQIRRIQKSFQDFYNNLRNQ